MQMLHTPGTWPPMKWQASRNFSDSTLSAASTSGGAECGSDSIEGPFDLSDELCEPSVLQLGVDGYANSHSSLSWSGTASTSRSASRSPVRPRSPLQPRIKRLTKVDSENFQVCAGPAAVATAVEARTPRTEQEQIDIDIETVQSDVLASAGDGGSAFADADSDYFCSSSDLAAARRMWAQPPPTWRLLAFEAHAWSL